MGKSWSKWNDEDIEVLKELWPTAPKERIEKALPKHSWNAIYQIASRLKIRRNHPPKKTPRLCPSSDLAYILGVLYGDGYVRKTADRYPAYCIALQSVDRMFVESFASALRRIGLNPYICGPYGKVYYTSATSVVFFRWFKSLTLEKVEMTLNGKEVLMKAFIRGLYESEGSTGTYIAREKRRGYSHQIWRVVICNTHRALLEMAQRFLDRLNYKFFLSKGSMKHSKWQKKPIYSLRTDRRNQVFRFHAEIQPCIKQWRQRNF